MLGAEASPGSISIGTVSARMNVSRHHLMKVAQGLVKAGLLEAVRGRSGGFRLIRGPHEIRVGEAIRSLESELGLVVCMRVQDSDCPLAPACRLPDLFRRATAAFFQVLDDCTLQDLVTHTPNLINLTGVR